ncbi:AAA family ATPase [Amycolatopsis sp. SB7-3]|uniref:AAA family ATPase n=1 Tax=Amycolatopsis sp. SB7-3 TaxID=3373438 RepID=UPI0037423FF4
MDFVVIFGPPAVGKMTVGEELCELTGFKLFHNHMTVEPVLGIFPFGSPPFGRLVNEFRRRVIEEAADAALPGLVFTYVWGLDLPEDTDLIASYVDIVRSRGGRTRFVELYADLDERLERNTTELRLDRKPSKRDLDFSRANLLELDRDYVMNTDDTRRTYAQDLIERHDHVRIDNTRLAPAETAALILREMPQ